MTRRDLIVGAFAGAPAAAAQSSRSSGRPKSVLLIMSDQHKRDCLGIAGDAVARTPNLDALAKESVRFRSAYCSNPVCTPSRASLLTGLYTHHHRTWNNTTPWPIENKTAAHHFGRAGYITGLIGKMHFVDAQTHGFDYRLDFNDWYQSLGPKTKLYADELSRTNSGSGLPQIDNLWRGAGDPWQGARELDEREGPVHVGRVSKLSEADHFETFVARETVRFLRTYAAKQQPFFLVSSFLKPHDPFMPAQRFANMFRAADMQLPRSWGKVDPDRVPKEVRESIRRNSPTPELRNLEAARQRIAYYYANLAQMDDCAGIVLRALRELGLEKDTIVAYTSDHGEMLGEHGLWQKFQFYEASCGVPLMVRAPGLFGAGVCDSSVSQVGFLPTLAELCDVGVPSRMDDTSFAAQLRNPRLPRMSPVFAEYNLGTRNAKYMIRDGEFKYSFWTHDIAELYNLRSDPDELNNLAWQQQYSEKVQELKTKLFAWYTPPEIDRTN